MKIVKKYKEIPLPCKIDARGEDWEKVEKIIFELGFRWQGGEVPPTGFGPFFFLYKNKRATYANKNWFGYFQNHANEEISFNDILQYDL